MSDNQSTSILPWIISLVLLITAITGWFFYYKSDTALSKNEMQSKRLQTRYDNKVKELYRAWDDLQKSKNEQFAVLDKSQSCEAEKKQLSAENQNLNSNIKNIQQNHQTCKNQQQQQAQEVAEKDKQLLQLKEQLQEQLLQSETLAAEKTTELEELNQQLNNLHKQISDYDKQNEVHAQNLSTKETELVQSIEKFEQQLVINAEQTTLLAATQKQITELEQQSSTTSQNLTSLESKYNELAAQQIQTNLARQQLDACNITLNKNTHMLEELADLKKLKEQLIPALGACRFELKDIKQQLKLSQQQLQDEQNKNKQRQEQNSTQQKQAKILQGQVDKCQQTSQQNQKSLKECQAQQLEQANIVEKNTNVEIATLQKKLLQSNTTLKDIQSKNTSLNVEVNQLKANLNQLRVKQENQFKTLNNCTSDNNNYQQQLDAKQQQIIQFKDGQKKEQQCQELLQQEKKETSMLDQQFKDLSSEKQSQDIRHTQLLAEKEQLEKKTLKLQDIAEKLQVEQLQIHRQLQDKVQGNLQLSGQLQAIEAQQQLTLEKEQEELSRLTELLKDEIDANFVTIKQDTKDSSIRIKITNNLIFNLGDTHISMRRLAARPFFVLPSAMG